jgi:putative hydrolase of the HAD superfamily
VSRIEAIITDFGGVLTTPLFEAFAHVQEQHGIPLEALGKAMVRVAQDRGENPLYGLERGELAEREFLGLLGSALEAELGRAVEMEGFADGYFDRLEPNEEFVAELRRIKEAHGLRLAILTNNVREWEGRWRAMLPGDDIFDLVVDSAFVGMRKPEPGIYELTLERLGLPAAACLFVDDIDVNVEAARALGIRSVHFRDTAQAVAELRAALG